MAEKRTYRQYPREFKEEAVALSTDQGYSAQKAADSLCIRSNLLYCWQRQLKDQKSGKNRYQKMSGLNSKNSVKKCENCV